MEFEIETADLGIETLGMGKDVRTGIKDVRITIGQ